MGLWGVDGGLASLRVKVGLGGESPLVMRVWGVDGGLARPRVHISRSGGKKRDAIMKIREK